jgi:hypothetical protein
MDADADGMRRIIAIVAVVLFNLPIVFGAWRLTQVTDLNQALREKDETTGEAGPVSYSRVTGMIGATVVASLFWMISNIAIWTAIVSPKDLTSILASVQNLFYVGAALFIPYAFNQLKTLVK